MRDENGTGDADGNGTSPLRATPEDTQPRAGDDVSTAREIVWPQDTVDESPVATSYLLELVQRDALAASSQEPLHDVDYKRITPTETELRLLAALRAQASPGPLKTEEVLRAARQLIAGVPVGCYTVVGGRSLEPAVTQALRILASQVEALARVVDTIHRQNERTVSRLVALRGKAPDDETWSELYDIAVEMQTSITPGPVAPRELVSQSASPVTRLQEVKLGVESALEIADRVSRGEDSHISALTVPLDCRVALSVLAKTTREMEDEILALREHISELQGRPSLYDEMVKLSDLLKAPDASAVVNAVALVDRVLLRSSADIRLQRPSPERLYQAFSQVDDLLGFPIEENLRAAATVVSIVLRSPRALLFVEEIVPRVATQLKIRLSRARDAVGIGLTGGDVNESLSRTCDELEEAWLDLSPLLDAQLLGDLPVKDVADVERHAEDTVDDLVSPVFQGVHAARTRVWPNERAAAQLWEAENTGPGSIAREPDRMVASWKASHSLLGHLLSRDALVGITPSQRDWLVASTVVQWLGTEAGQRFARLLFSVIEKNASTAGTSDTESQL